MSETGLVHHTNDLCDVLCYLNRLCDKWFNIGVYLKVDSMKLQEIRSQYPSQADALREMLIYRLKQKLTWEMIQAAVMSPIVNSGLLESKSVKRSIILPLHIIFTIKHHHPHQKKKQVWT